MDNLFDMQNKGLDVETALERAKLMCQVVQEEYLETAEPNMEKYMIEYSRACTYMDIVHEYIIRGLQGMKELQNMLNLKAEVQND